MKFYTHPLAAAVLCALGQGALAQTPAPANPEAQSSQEPSLQAVTVRANADAVSTSVATRLPASAMETPFTVTDINETVIDQSSATTLSDVMRYAATVGGTDNFGNSGEFFSSRGFQLSAGNNYFRDGLRYRKYGQVPLYDIERIEFLRGPASVLYGALQPGGVVNIVSRKPQDTFSANVKLRYGSNQQRQASVDVTGPINDRVRYRLQALHGEGNSFRDHVDGRARGISAQVEMDLSRDTLLTFRASTYSDRRTGDRGTVLATDANGQVDFADVPRSRFLGEPWAQFEFSDTNVSLGLRHQFNADWQLRADWVHSRQSEDRTYMWFLSDNTPVGTDGQLKRQVGDWDAKLRGNLVRVETVGSFTTGEVSHRLLMGLESERFINRRTNLRWEASPINIYAPNYSFVRPENGKNTLNSVYANRDESLGLYAQNMMKWRDSITVLAGIRWDKVESKDPDKGTAVDYAKGVTPQLGIVFHPTPWISPYLSYTRSFMPQDGTDRFGNRFDPQKSRQWEAGVKLDLADQKTFVTASVFKLDKQNLKVTDPEDPSFSRLSGLQRSKGFELAVQSRPLKGLQLSVNYAYLAEAKFVNDNRYSGNTIPNAAKHALGVFADYRFQGDWSRWNANVGLSHVGERQGTDNNSFQLPAYTLVDLGVRYHATPQLVFSASVRNAFDQTYYTGAINATTVGVGAPRQAFVGMEWRL